MRVLYFVSYLWIFGAILGGMMALDQGISEFGSISCLDGTGILSDYTIANISIPYPNTQKIECLTDMVTWNFPFFQGDWAAIRTFFLYPISLIATLMIIVSLGPILISLVTAIRNLFRI